MRVTIQVDDGGVVTTDQPTTTSAPAPRGPESAPAAEQPSAELAARAAASGALSAGPAPTAGTTAGAPPLPNLAPGTPGTPPGGPGAEGAGTDVAAGAAPGPRPVEVTRADDGAVGDPEEDS